MSEGTPHQQAWDGAFNQINNEEEEEEFEQDFQMGDTEVDDVMSENEFRQRADDLYVKFAYQFMADVDDRHPDFDPDEAESVDLRDRYPVRVHSETQLIKIHNKAKKYYSIKRVSLSKSCPDFS